MEFVEVVHRMSAIGVLIMTCQFMDTEEHEKVVRQATDLKAIISRRRSDNAQLQRIKHSDARRVILDCCEALLGEFQEDAKNQENPTLDTIVRTVKIYHEVTGFRRHGLW